MIDTKIQILDYAEFLARERGYDAFSYADIAEKIGIKKASIHYHFPKKSDLALALIERYREKLSAHLMGLNHPEKTASDKIRAYISLYKDALSDGSTICLCIAFSAAKENLSPLVIEQLSLFGADNIDWLSDVFILAQSDNSISNVQDPEAEAYACHAIVQGAHLMARSDVRQFEYAVSQLVSRLSASKEQ